MPSTYLSIKNLVLSAVGRDDTVTDAYAVKGVNYGVLAAALLFSPPELALATSFVISTGDASADVSSITGIRSFKVLYNSTDKKRVWPMTKDKFDILTGGLSSGVIEFYTRHGNYLYFSDTPDADTTIKALYNKYPPAVTNFANELPFDNFDEFITSEATKFVFACLEEGESVKIFDEMATKLLSVHAVDKQLKDELEAALKSGYSL